MLKKREQFGSQFGLIMAAVGSAVGLGNIWRFSYIAGVNGGGAFLVVYLLCVLLIGLPVLIAELTIGRRSGLSTVSAFRELAPGTFWWVAGAIGVLASTAIACYYPAVAGWSLGYVFESIANWSGMTADTAAAFGEFSAGPKSYIFAAAALALAMAILIRGVAAGIEKWSKMLMPALGGIMVILVIRSVTLPGAGAGVAFLLMPDFSEFTVGGFLDALGHSFYSLSLGMGVMITYASYMKKSANLAAATTSIIAMDTGIALLAGLAIFPAVFAMGLRPDEGPGLVFVTLPMAFTQMPFGQIFCTLFFLLVFIAALTSLISILQVPLAMLEDRFGISRRKGLAIIAAVAVCFGAPSVMAFGVLKDFSIMGLDYFTFLDRFANNILLPISALLGILFIIFSFGVAASRKEFLEGAGGGGRFMSALYPIAVRTVAPAAIVVIILRAAGVF
ncbi:MAG: sodium-dependent transporter [Clostridiales Family XIII bacterium]|nr:sodium-dependent transporter [Clostridiales Family XIII bacterium]